MSGPTFCDEDGSNEDDASSVASKNSWATAANEGADRDRDRDRDKDKERKASAAAEWQSLASKKALECEWLEKSLTEKDYELAVQARALERARKRIEMLELGGDFDEGTSVATSHHLNPEIRNTSASQKALMEEKSKQECANWEKLHSHLDQITASGNRTRSEIVKKLTVMHEETKSKNSKLIDMVEAHSEEFEHLYATIRQGQLAAVGAAAPPSPSRFYDVPPSRPDLELMINKLSDELAIARDKISDAEHVAELQRIECVKQKEATDNWKTRFEAASRNDDKTIQNLRMELRDRESRIESLENRIRNFDKAEARERDSLIERLENRIRNFESQKPNTEVRRARADLKQYKAKAENLEFMRDGQEKKIKESEDRIAYLERELRARKEEIEMLKVKATAY
ncbi:hypothetical protein T439DRAFT_380111 [Meredithblackwellia eburnea MCA 4105]